jgi:nucleolin
LLDVHNMCANTLFVGTSGRKRGFGHIDFVSPEDAKRAIEMLNGAEVGGRGLRIDHARRKEDGAPTGAAAPRTARSPDGAPRSYPERSSDNSVFLGNLAWDVTEDLLKEMLDDIIGAGSYTNVRLATDRETGRLKGYAHVDFVDTPTATRAVQELNNLSVLERPLRADLAQRKTLSSGGSGGGAGYGGGKSGGSGGFRSNGSANGNGYGAKRDFGGY